MNVLNKIKSVLVLLILPGFVICCSAPQEPVIVNQDKIESDIKVLNSQLDEIEFLCKNLTIDNYLSFFHEDAVILPPGQAPIKGIEGIREFYSMFEEVFIPSFDLVYSERNFEVEDSLAVRRYEGYAELYLQDGSDTLISNNKYIDLLKKQSGGSWKIVWHMWNENEPTK